MKAFLLFLMSLFVAAATASADDSHLRAAIDGKHRTQAYIERDKYRHPFQTLKLFDIQPQHTVVEVWPGGGWYTEILAPYLRDDGVLIAAHYDTSDTQASYRPTVRKRFNQKMAADKAVYGNVKIGSLMIDESARAVVIPAAEPNSVDRVVTFRNAHGLTAKNVLGTALSHFHEILKPGGKLGIVQHQADPNQDWKSKNIGYVGRDHIVAEALKAGFTLHGEGYFNNNRLDTKHYKIGVWQLPPSLRNLETDEEKAPYLAIGESDRMTLVFVK